MKISKSRSISINCIFLVLLVISAMVIKINSRVIRREKGHRHRRRLEDKEGSYGWDQEPEDQHHEHEHHGEGEEGEEYEHHEDEEDEEGEEVGKYINTN